MQNGRFVAARRHAAVAGVIFGTLAATSLPLAAQAQSPALAKELVAGLTSKKLECVAAKDPAHEGQYVAALHLPGLQLLVVAARFADPTSMDFRLFSGDCMGAYADLNAAVTAQDRVIYSDLGADGLNAAPKKDAPRDAVTKAGAEMKFDADKNALKTAKLTPDEYQKRFAEADAQYADFLKLLLGRLKG
jgi:hypothetical protein